jgi:hypothetical protein
MQTIQILSHRGFWEAKEERNTLTAFERSFHHGFGLETDVRDSGGRLYISHDPVEISDAAGHNSGGPMTAEAFFDLYRKIGNGLPLAINIKSDGLQTRLRDMLSAYDVTNYFVFDMSVPDTLGYVKLGMPFFTRESEYEPEPALYDAAAGVWMDCFKGEWFTEADIARHLDAGKQVCLVSPELHQRPHGPFWERLRGWSVAARPELMLCTDFPTQAKRMFIDED